jgi:hypothetical protein
MQFQEQYCEQRTCLNGHVVSNEAEYEPVQEYCHKCGAKVIANCPKCDGLLRGQHKYRSVKPDPKPDAYCVHCGAPLPWTESHVAAVRDIASEIDSLNDTDRKTLGEILPDLVARETTPRTELGIVKMKTLLKKGGATFYEASNKLLVDVLSEAVKKSLFGP